MAVFHSPPLTPGSAAGDAGAVRPAAGDGAASKAVGYCVIALLVSIFALERIGFPIGQFSLNFSLPLIYLLLLAAANAGVLRVDHPSFFLYAALLTVGLLSLLLNGNYGVGDDPSTTSLLLLAALYLPFVFFIKGALGDQSPHLWLTSRLAHVLYFMALAGLVQFYGQFVFRPPWWFDISLLLPEAIRAPGVYNTAIPVGSLFKANGFVSREPSMFSFAMAFGLLLELTTFRRVLRSLVFILALFVSYSGTGILALIIALLIPVRPKLLLRIGVGAGTLIAINALAGDPLNLSFTYSRIGEFGAPTSSAYIRYIAPINLVMSNIDLTSWSFWLGNGAGKIVGIATDYQSHDPTWAKLLYEYGVLGFAACLGLVIRSVVASRQPTSVRAMLFAYWLVMGGYLLTINCVLMLVALMSLWKVETPASNTGTGRS